MKRYLLVTSRYVYFSDDTTAKESTDRDAKIEALKYDNGAKVVSLEEAAWGSAELRQVI